MIRRSPNGFGKSNVGRVARAIYLRDVLPILTSDDYGKYLYIDCETGLWELDASELEAAMRAWRTNPTCRNRIGIRIGYHDHDAQDPDDGENWVMSTLIDKSPGTVSPGQVEYMERWYKLACNERSFRG